MKDMGTVQFNTSRTTYKKCEVLVVMVIVVIGTLCNTYKDYSKRLPFTSEKKIILKKYKLQDMQFFYSVQHTTPSFRFTH
jgi:hypothetical protein